MSKKNKDLDFEASIKKCSRKELQKICRHFQQMNIMAVTDNHYLSESVRELQDSLSGSRHEVAHKQRLIEALANS